MAENGVTYSSASIRQLGADLIDGADVLIKMIETARAKIEATRPIFDTPNATNIRRSMDEYAKNAKAGVGENFGNLAESFEAVAKIYEQQEVALKQQADKYLDTSLFQTE